VEGKKLIKNRENKHEVWTVSEAMKLKHFMAKGYLPAAVLKGCASFAKR
jgi:hypothetical protein